MKITRHKRALAVILGLILAVSPCMAGGSGLPFISLAEERAATVHATNLNVRSGAGTSYPSLTKLSYGMSVTVLGEQRGTDGNLWYQIRFTGSSGTPITGYVSAQYIRFPSAVQTDGDFEQYMASQGFPESYKQGLRELHAQYPQWRFTAFQTNLDWNTVIANESVIGRNLVARNNVSSWKSTAEGAYDWNTGTWPGFDGSSWVQASEDIIRYYMDPRNFLNEKYIFQFMKQSYDSSIHTRAGLESMVAGTFLAGGSSGSGSSANGAPGSSGGEGGSAPGTSGGENGSAPGSGTQAGSAPGGSGNGAAGPGAGNASQPPSASDPSSTITPVASVSDHAVDLVTTAYGPGMDTGGSGAPSADNGNPGGSAPTSGTISGSGSYIDMIMNAAAQSGVSPYILASMILQEQGSQGTGRSISGTVSGYQGYYNFFNIESYQSGSMGAVERGLWWASQSGSYGRPWNSVERSILGGALWYGDNYVKKGQDTLYLKKFNVQGSNLYKHQYMTNVLAAAAEGLTLAKISSLKTTALEFSIPVYQNMPDTPCVKPTLDGSPNNKLSGLGVEGFALTPTFNRDTESYDLIVDPSVSSVAVHASAIDSKAVVSGVGSVNLQSGVNDITVSVKAENGSVRSYVIHVVRQSNGPVYSDSAGTGTNGGGSGSGGSTAGGSSGAGPGPGSPGLSGGQTSSPPADSSTESNSGSAPPSSSGSGSAPGNGQGSGSGSGSSGFPAVPGTGTVNGFGSANDSSSLTTPNGNIRPPIGSGSGTSGSGSAGSGGSGGAPAPDPGSANPGNPGSGSGGSGGASNPGSGSANPGGGSFGGYRIVSPGTTAADVASALIAEGAGTRVKVCHSAGGDVSGAVATGHIAYAYSADGSPQAQYEIVVKGDNNGDGKLSMLDVLRARRHILKMETLTGACEKATDVNGNGRIDIMDILIMQKDILGLEKIQ